MKINRVTSSVHDRGEESFRVDGETCKKGSGNWILYLGADCDIFISRDRLAELHRVIGEALGVPAETDEPCSFPVGDCSFKVPVATSPGTQDHLEDGR